MPATITAAVATAANGIALTLLDALIAACPAFQARVGAQNELDAGKHIFWPFLGTPPEPEQRPFAVIYRMPGGTHYDLQSGGSQNNLLPAGTLHLILCDNDRIKGDFKASLIDFENFAGRVIQYLADQSAVDGNLSIVRMDEEVPPQYPHAASAEAQEGEPFWETRWAIEWGIGSS